MLRSIVLSFSTALLLVVAPVLSADTPLSMNGRLQVIGTQLCNQYGYPIQLRGMSTHGLQWFANCIDDASLDVLANGWGADHLRLSMYVQEGGYETNPAKYTALVDGLVEKVLARGMYALIDWHQLDPGDPNDNLDMAITYFTHMSQTHAGKKGVIYEICNEPNGTVDWPGIKSYAEQIIPIIRGNDPDALIIVGTPTWCQTPNDVIGDELDFPNIMYTVHFYAASHKKSIRDNVIEAIDGGVPVFVTECGTQEASGDGADDFVESVKWFDMLDEYKISWTNWNYSDDMRSGAVWNEGTCGSGDWVDANLKPAGVWIKKRMSSPADDFQVPATAISSWEGTGIVNGIGLRSVGRNLFVDVRRSDLVGKVATVKAYTVNGRCAWKQALVISNQSTVLDMPASASGMYVVELKVPGSDILRQNCEF